MWAGQKRKELEMHTAGKKLKQRDNVVYVGGTICGDGSLNIAIRSRIETDTNAMKKVEGMVGYRQLSRILSMHTCMAYRNDGTNRKTAEGA